MTKDIGCPLYDIDLSATDLASEAEEQTNWPPRDLMIELIAMGSTLDCFTVGSGICAVCRAVMEIPLALARSNDAAPPGRCRIVEQEMRSAALYVAELLLGRLPSEPELIFVPGAVSSNASAESEDGARAIYKNMYSIR